MCLQVYNEMYDLHSLAITSASHIYAASSFRKPVLEVSRIAQHDVVVQALVSLLGALFAGLDFRTSSWSAFIRVSLRIATVPFVYRKRDQKSLSALRESLLLIHWIRCAFMESSAAFTDPSSRSILECERQHQIAEVCVRLLGRPAFYGKMSIQGQCPSFYKYVSQHAGLGTALEE